MRNNGLYSSGPTLAHRSSNLLTPASHRGLSARISEIRRSADISEGWRPLGGSLAREIEVPGEAPFIGFVGLAVPGFSAHFTPCVEVGWGLAFEHWGRGYATEAARLALGYGFGTLALSEVVSFTSATNQRSRAVMERLGMRRDPADDFDHPAMPEGHPLRSHVLYRLGSGSYFGMC
jgi:RimJ/RimL family protein N-acetyltransferase